MELKKHLNKIIFLLIILVATATRFYMLGETPSGFYVDEAGQGYSAYSILKTGKDEFGKSFPVVFRSMTDFRTPIYTYLSILPIKLFGLNAFSTRFVSFFFGILTLPIIYLLTYQLSKNKKLALIVMAMISISPWHTLFSRTAYETNMDLFFLFSGLLFFYYSFKKPIFLVLSSFFLSISIVGYQTERIVVPIFLVILFAKYKKLLLSKSYIKPFVISVVIGLLILLPTLQIVFTSGFWARASGLNIFTNTQGHNSFLYTIREFASLYITYFSPRFMFILGDYDTRMNLPELSTFFIWQFPLYLWGLWILFKEKVPAELKSFTILSLLIFPIPASITHDPYSTIRSMPILLPITIIISLAINKLLNHNSKWLILITALYFYSILKLYSSMIVLNDHYRAKYWNWGWQNVAEEISKNTISKKTVVDNARGDVYLQLAFFLKYDPKNYQSQNFEVPLTEYYTNPYHTSEKNIGNIVTRPIDWKNDLSKDQILIGDELAISMQQIKEHNLKLIKEIYFPDGSIAYRIVSTNPIWEKTKNAKK